ncbi:MAG TPA: ATP-dependent zinc protease [Allocoleopsis sp.]
MKSSNKRHDVVDPSLPIIGWQEAVQLPELSIKVIAKVDTGARSSALHARDIEVFWKGKKKMVRFKVEPYMTSNVQTEYIEVRLLEQRIVKSSNGQTELRPVIKTTLKLGSETFEIELTLTNRELMGYAMLLGRAAISNRFMIHPGKAFLLSSRPKKRKSPQSLNQ